MSFDTVHPPMKYHNTKLNKATKEMFGFSSKVQTLRQGLEQEQLPEFEAWCSRLASRARHIPLPNERGRGRTATPQDFIDMRNAEICYWHAIGFSPRSILRAVNLGSLTIPWGKTSLRTIYRTIARYKQGDAPWVNRLRNLENTTI